MKKRISEVACEAWGVPKDILMNIPRMTISGDREIYIENHKGILKYRADEIDILTPDGTVKVFGENLNIDRIRAEDISISGIFSRLEYDGKKGR